jgi:tRNA threonylcarbamoyl adenosine modification protein YjeE
MRRVRVFCSGAGRAVYPSAVSAEPAATLLVEGPRAEVRRAGERLGAAAVAGDVIALVGGLGAGKTFLAQAIARGAGVPPRVRVASPTFTVVQRYDGRIPVYHADVYRLGDARELDEIGLFEVGIDGLVVIEWADRVASEVPPSALWIELERSRSLRRRLWARGTSDEARRLIATCTAVAPG